MKQSINYGEITGPIVIVGFGSIGKGCLPLIEKHFQYDSKRMVVIDPSDKDRKILDQRGIKFLHMGLTAENYVEVLTPLLTEGGERFLCQFISRCLVIGCYEVMSRAGGLLYRYSCGTLGWILF